MTGYGVQLLDKRTAIPSLERKPSGGRRPTDRRAVLCAKSLRKSGEVACTTHLYSSWTGRSRRRARPTACQSRSAPAHAAKHSPPTVPVTVMQHSSGRRRCHAARCRGSAPQPRRRRSGRAEADRASTTAISTADRVEQRGIDADRIQQQPVAEDLREDRDQHERDHAAPAVAGCAARARPLHSSRPLRAAEMPQARARRPDHRERDDRQPPRQAEWSDERERRRARRASPRRRGSGNSAAISVGTCGLTSGDERRSAAILAATPSCPLTTLPSTCMLDAR